MSKVITGLFKNPTDASAAVDYLVARGVPIPDISVLASENVANDEAFAVETHSKLSEGAAIGAGTGGAIGAIIAGFTAVGAIATGGAGLLVAGPLVAAFAGAGAGAAAGSVLGGLVGLAIPEHEVKYYEDAIEEGSVLVGVNVEGDAAERNENIAKEIFKDCDAARISHA